MERQNSTALQKVADGLKKDDLVEDAKAPMSLDDHLKKQQLLPATTGKYKATMAAVEGHDSLKWLQSRLDAHTPIGTVLPYRAAVRHYLMASQGYSDEEVQELLPKARGLPTAFRSALTVDALAAYHLAIEEIPDPCRTVLDLLPKTGLRISEICNLTLDSIKTPSGIKAFVFRGKRGKERIVPLSKSGESTLNKYLETFRPTNWLFEGRFGSPITPHAVRKYTRKLAANNPDELDKLSPHVLRHTYATLLVARGVDLKTIQQLLGHENIETTSRYLHPSVADLKNAVAKIDQAG